MVAVVGIQPIVATLAVLVGGRGVALVLAEGRLTEVFDPTLTYLGSGRVLGVPFNVIVAAVIALLIGAMVRRTIIGRQLVAVGGNREASVLAGVPVKRTLFAVYVTSGVLAAIAGLLLTGRSGAANPAYIGLDYELFAITAVVVGGTPLTGGRIRVAGTVMGALLMQLVSTTLVSHNLTDSDRRIVTALIIVGRSRSNATEAGLSAGDVTRPPPWRSGSRATTPRPCTSIAARGPIAASSSFGVLQRSGALIMLVVTLAAGAAAFGSSFTHPTT